MPSDDVIITRRFGRADGDVLLFLHQPQPDPKIGVDADPDDPSWRCFYTIRYPDGFIQRRSAMGVDGMQAMLLAIAAAQGDLRNSIGGERRLPIRFLGEEDLGLQIPQYD